MVNRSKSDCWSVSCLQIACVLATLGAGCGAGPEQDHESVGEQASAVAVGNWSDDSGKVKITLYQGPWTTAAHQNKASATLGFTPTETLCGGGAEILGETNPGALLTGAEPVSFSQFRAASKDHSVSQLHQLRAYALAISIRAPNGVFLASSSVQSEMYIIWHDEPSNGLPQAHPEGHSDPGNDPHFLAGDIALGGGAWAHDGAFNPSNSPTTDVAWNHAGQLLSMSGGQNSMSDDVWITNSKDHVISDPGFLETAAIMIHRCSTLWTGCLQPGRFEVSFFVGSGYQPLTLNSSWPWAATSVGGGDIYNGAGRLLTDLIPTVGSGRGGVTVRTKDHVVADGGKIYASLPVIRMAPPPCSCGDGF
jgi:hypothetical protein